MEEVTGAFLVGASLRIVLLSYCCCIHRAESVQAKKTSGEPCGGFHQEEGGPLLFLMVASEHSASDESQSESPNCSGF